MEIKNANLFLTVEDPFTFQDRNSNLSFSYNEASEYWEIPKIEVGGGYKHNAIFTITHENDKKVSKATEISIYSKGSMYASIIIK